MKCLILLSFTIVCMKIRCVRNPDARKVNVQKKDVRNLNSHENFMDYGTVIFPKVKLKHSGHYCKITPSPRNEREVQFCSSANIQLLAWSFYMLLKLHANWALKIISTCSKVFKLAKRCQDQGAFCEKQTTPE